jgi:hypothetical protein
VQTLAVEIIVGLALLYVARRVTQTWFGQHSGCGSGCGKCSPPAEESKPGRVSLNVLSRVDNR